MNLGSCFMGYGNGFGMITFWIITIVLVMVLVKSFSSKSYEAKTEEDPMQILKKRYAKGELSKEEFDSMKKDIQS